jgi:hypothetical protein
MENVSKKLSTSIVMAQTAKPKLWQQLFLFNKGDTGFSQKKKKNRSEEGKSLDGGELNKRDYL